MRTAVLLVVLLSTAAPAAALTVTHAVVTRGAIQVRGKHAPPAASITWQGTIVGTASPAGKFEFRTTERPRDCVGTVSDGTSVAQTVIAGCTPAHRGLVVTDATGRAIGPYMSDPSGELVVEAVALPTAAVVVLTSFTSASFAAYPPFGLWYESADCSGTPLIPTFDSPIHRAVGYDGGRVYYGMETGDRTTLMSFERRGVQSGECTRSGGGFTPPNRCCYPQDANDPPSMEAAPARTIDVSGFVPPFRVGVQ